MSELRIDGRMTTSSEGMSNGKRKLPTITGETMDNKRLHVEYNDEVDTGIWDSLFNSKGKARNSSRASSTTDNRSSLLRKTSPLNAKEAADLQETSFDSKVESKKCSTASATTLIRKTPPLNTKESGDSQVTSFTSKSLPSKTLLQQTSSFSAKESRGDSEVASFGSKDQTISATSAVRRSPRKPGPLENGIKSKKSERKDVEEVNHVMKSKRKKALRTLSSKSVNANDTWNGLKGRSLILEIC